MIPLFTSAQIRKADDFAIRRLGIPGAVLMENAALNIYRKIKLAFPNLTKNSPVGFIAGKGNNGGDAYATARHFANAHFSVVLLTIASERELKGDALLNFNILKNIAKINGNIKIKKYSSARDLKILDGCQLIIDGLLGTGAKGELREPFARIVDYANSLNVFRAAIDIPTGLDVDTGWGELVFDADITVTLAELKRGLFFAEGYAKAGEIYKGGIGLGDEYFDKLNVSDYLIEPEDAFSAIPERRIDDYKYSAGKTLIIAGSKKFPGAAVFSANAAADCGSGAVIVAVPNSVCSVLQNNVESSVVESYDDEETGFLREANPDDLQARIEWADVVAIGPGLGRNASTLKAVKEIVSRNPSKRFVIDADAVSAFDFSTSKKMNLSNVVFTPHLGEFSDLLNVESSEIRKDLLAYGKKFAKASGAVLVLKGAPTIIFTPSGEALINTTGNAALAKFGSGDVLTGIVSSYIAQNKKIEPSVVSAVYIHGLAADIYTEDYDELSLSPAKLINYIPNAVKFIYDTFI